MLWVVLVDEVLHDGAAFKEADGRAIFELVGQGGDLYVTFSATRFLSVV